jgi:hypothetical protein
MKGIDIRSSEPTTDLNSSYILVLVVVSFTMLINFTIVHNFQRKHHQLELIYTAWYDLST